MERTTVPKSRKRTITAFLCSLASLVIWFLPGSYYFYYLESDGTGVWVTSLFDFIPILVILPVISLAVTVWAVCRIKITDGMVWTMILTTLLQGIFLSFIQAINLRHFAGETFIWLETFPFPLTVISTICLHFSSRYQHEKEQ